MKKTVQTTAWQFSKQLLAIACFLVIGMVQVAAQNATANYITTLKVTSISWSGIDYGSLLDDEVDVPLIGQTGSPEFFFSANGASFYTGDDVNATGNLGGLNSPIWSSVVPVGANLGAIGPVNITFQAYEFDTASDNDAVVLTTSGVDWSANVDTDPNNGQFITGNYAVAPAVFAAPGGGTYTFNLSVTVVAAAPAINTCLLSVTPTGNTVSYACLSDAAANTSVSIGGGTAPYKILGSGIYDAVTGDPFDFGVDPFGLTVGAGTFEFQVREGQPWTVIVQDAVGCIVAQEGVFDLPNPLFNTPATMCTSDPVINIFENSIFDPAGDILNGQFFFSVAGGVDNGDGFSATFDPFIAGPGQHFIAYCVQAQGGGGPGFGPGNYEDGCQICYEQTIYVYPSFDGYDGAGNLVTEIGLNTGGSPEADAALQTNVCVGHANMSLGLTNFDDFDALFASLELAFDPNGQIDETDFFITWAGNGVTDNADGTATFSPAALGPVPPGGIATSIQVTVGYPSCPTVYVVVMNVMPNFNATVNDVATCATAGDSYDLTGAFGANTTAGGYFYTVGAGGALTAVTSGTLSEAANAGTSVTILYSNTAGLTNQSQCNADDCINCDTAVITFSGLTVDCSFALEDGPEVCRGTTPLVDTVVDPIITNSPVTGIQATAVGNNVIPKDLTTTASLGTIDPYGFINSIEVEINYTGLNGNTQGDHNGYSVTMPGGVTFVAADVPVGQTSNYTVTYTNGTAAWNTDIPTPNNDTFNDHTITWEQIQAAYANANLNINDVFTGTNAPGLVGTCQENEFTFDLETNANNAAISITVTPSYVEPAGFVTAFIWSTGTQLPAEAITFDNVTGEYYLNTLFTDANGSAWDLSTYLDIELVHTTYSCSAQLPDGTLCTQSCTEVIKVLPALITDIANLTACINDGAIDLEQMFIQGTATGTDGINITGGTTQGGVFTATNGTVNGTYFTPNAGATSSTITYTIGAGTGADGCDPLPSTATLTLETAADPEFNYPTTVCVGSIPALPAAAAGTTSGLQVFDPQGNNISHAAFQAATVGGLYTIEQTTGPAGCQDEYIHSVLVVASPTAVSANATVCRSQAVVDLTQFVAGSTMGGNFTGTGVAGEVLILGTLTSSTITYTVGSNGCTATTTFTITIVDQPNAAFDVIDQICEGTTVNLYDYTLQDGGAFTNNGVAVPNPAAWTATGEGLHNLVYTIGGGTSCTATDQENVYVIGDQTVTAEYGFLCQSTTDFTIDLTDQLTDGSNSPNGGTFTMRQMPAFISEIEYTGGPTIDGRDFIEVTAPAGTNLNEYALVFYKRMGYTADNSYNDPVNSGAVYGVIDMANLQPNQTVGATTPNGTIVDSEVTGLNGISYGSVGVKYFDVITPATPVNPGNPGNDVAPIGQTITGIADGPAAVALVYKGSATRLEDLDTRLGPDDVVQFIGYGTSLTNTNAGIFSACDGPARSLVSVDINTVDKDETDNTKDHSVQFTNTCWVNPKVDDAEVAYATSPAPNVTSTGVGIPAYATVGDLTSAGSLNVGLRGDTPGNEGYLSGRGHGDELYFDYVAPNGDVLHLDRLCKVLFVGGQVVNTADYVNPENGNTSGNANNYGNQVPSTLQVDGNNDDDNDGILDWEDSDFDNDGLQDDAGDAVSNLGDLDFDNDGIINSIDTDDDNDGLVDNGPGDTTVAFDSDGDGMVDSVDTDDDNDGLSDNIDTNNDTDGDGLANSSDPDDDNDGVLDAADSDDDNDNIPDMLDIDQDNDGLTDIADPDDDNDGLLDADDNDTDNDGISDANDTDDDNDGLSEVVDNDDNGNGEPDSSDTDKDADGLPDTSPADANNDGIVDNTATSNTPTYVNCATVDCDDDNDGISDFADPDDDNDGIKDSADLDDDNDGVLDAVDNDSVAPVYYPELYNDDDEVEFTCETMTYTIPFGYQLLPGSPGSTQCGSNQAIFYLTVLMDGEENWNNYSISNPEGVLKEAVCDYSENNLNTYIDDIVHWISPIKRTGTFDTTATYTFEENIKDPLITELKYKDYGYTGPAADDHCVVYNYVDDNNTPFNAQDDNFTNARFCDGIEISAPEGTELSCYSLVFYSDNNILPQTPANGAGFDVTYINAMGVPAKTLIANGRYMQLYGLIDNDQTNAYPGGTIMTVPTFGLDIWNNYPYYAGANPLDASNQYGQAGAPAESGLYIDVNDNAAYDAGDVAVAGPTGFAGYDGASFPWERGTECAKNGVGARWFPILDVPGNGTEEIGGVGLINNCTGKLVDFISWGGELCVETKEDCSVAGPFEQLSSVEIDTVQSTLCCDLRTLQLVSASVADELTGSDCPSANADANGNVWVQVYNGGEYTIPGCGIYTADAEEFYEFSNSVGYYNCDLLEEAVIADPQAFTLDLADIDVSDNYIVTNHTIEVTIGSVQENYFQLYTYGISTGACGNLNSNDGLPGNVNIIPTNNPAMDNSVDLDENGNTNLITVVPGLTCGVPTHDNAIISQPAVGTNGLLNSLEEPWDTNPDNTIGLPGSSASYAYWDYNNPGVVNYWPNGLNGPTQFHNNPWSNGNQPSPIYMGSTIDNYGYPIYNGWGDNTPCMACGTDPNACIADGEYAPVMNNGASHTFNGSYTANGNPVGPGQLEFAFQDGQGPLNIEGGCFQSYCTSLAKTTYTVSDLTAYLYNGNTIPGYEDAISDSCRSLVFSNDDVRVRIRVTFDYEQCLPAGKFAGSDVSLNEEDVDMPYWVFAPQGLAETSPVSITYDVTNAHEIETDDATDDLACLDDDNDNMRTQDIEVLPAGSASLNTASVSTCTNSPALNLSSYVSGTTGGTWTANGGNLNGNSFSSSTAGTFTLTYTVGGGDCQDAASLTVTVGQSGSINTAGLPTSVCAGTAVLLPAGTWSGDGVTGDTFSSNTAGTYTLTGTAGSGACATTATVSITVVPALSVAVTQDCNGEQAVVTLTVSGGVGPYNVNGTGIAGSSTSFTVPSDSFFQYNVDDASACAGVSVNGIAATCIAPCIADAGTLNVIEGVVGGEICGNETIIVQATGFADCSTQTYALTDAAGNIVAVSASGQFSLATLTGADYTAWGINFTDGTTVPTNAGNIVLSDDLDVTNPITFTVVPKIIIELAAICDPNSGGYFLQATVSGGDPSINAFGSYTCNLSSGLVSGSFTTSGGDPINVVLGNGNATTSFAAGASVAVSFGDGSLCEASASFEFPDVACGIGAAPDNGFTFADQPIVIDVTNNDTGNLTPIAVTNPANGTATINPDGTITYTPDAGFTGTDVFVYQAITPNGSTVTSTVTVVVQGSSVAALSADWTRDCSDVATTSQYGVSVFIQGGVAPYTVAGTYNETNINDGNAFFSVPDGSGFQVVVTDANGNQFTIDESDIIPCSKVDAELVFSGEVKADGNLLKWTTFSEVNNDYFTLEFSRDGISYETIAIVDGAGNSTTNKNYNFTHKNVPNGVGYYRISTTDFDGTSVIKEVITLTRGEVKFGIVSLYPVPATTNLTVSFETAAAATVKASIFNVAGQLAIAKDVTAIAGTNTPTFNVTALPAGTYYISLNDGTNIATTKFVKQ